jgi:HAD superfamily hydrolase (TIGR01509 family)
MNMIKLIIFDIGDVIINFNDEEYVSYITKKLHTNAKTFMKCLEPLVTKMEYGAMNLKETEDTLAKRFNTSDSGLEWVKSYRKMARLNKPVFVLVNHLSKRYEVALLSNVGRARYIESLQLLDGIKADRVFASCYIKMRKPEARIYKYALKKMGMKPEEAIFIDNMKENVVGARKVGIKSILFTGYKPLVRDLKKLKII